MIKKTILKILNFIVNILGNPKKAPQGDIFYNSKAATYDNVRDSSKQRANERMILREYLNKIAPNKDVLDLPIGTGAFVDLYAMYQHRVLGADISNTMLEIAENKIPAELAENFTFDRLNILNEKFLARRFDVVISIRFLGEVLNLQQLNVALPRLVALSKKWLILDLGYSRFSILASNNENYASQASSKYKIENIYFNLSLCILFNIFQFN